jgi:hypothetical protein
MAEVCEYLQSAALIGIGATVLLDSWSFALKRLFNVALPDYGLVGRWVAYMARGHFRHDRISASPPLQGELLVGWAFHYLTGIAFASLLLAIRGIDWAHQPTIGPALMVGIGSVAAPFLLMQPGMGAGIAASRTPRPYAARLRSLVTHTIFGLALYVAAWATSFL